MDAFDLYGLSLSELLFDFFFLFPLDFLQAVVEEDCMPMDQFSQHLLPSLLSLSSDPVANVRVLVAKALRQSVMEKGNGQKQIKSTVYISL